MSTGRSFVPVVPSNTDDVPRRDGAYPTAFRFGTGGTAVFVGPDGVQATFTNIQDGETIPATAKQIKAAGSTGIADIVGLFI